MEKEEPEGELGFNSTLLEHVARRNLSTSLWRSHGMSSERPLYVHPDDRNVITPDVSVDDEPQATEGDELDDWCTDEKYSGIVCHPVITAVEFEEQRCSVGFIVFSADAHCC
jgi:hypothetical protein